MTYQDMTGGKPIHGEPRLAPPWVYISLTMMTIGIVVGGAVFARQGWHVAANRATAGDIHEIQANVEQLRGYVDELEAIQQINASRIKRVEAEQSGP